MRVLIVSTIVPFIEGGGTFIVDFLLEMLKRKGYKAEALKIPFSHDPRCMPSQIAGLRLLEFASHADRLIAIRTPSYVVRHPNKAVWFIHHHRTAYDLWGTEFQDLKADPEGFRVRKLFFDTDNKGLAEAKALFTNSRVVTERLRRYNQLDSEVLYPPLLDHSRFRCEEDQGYIFYPSRITAGKRQLLAVRAMAHTRTPVKLVIAGNPEYPIRILEEEVEKLELKDRVRIISQWISEDEKIQLMSRALGVTYIPFDEDSYGYVGLEASHSSKPILTCTDSGGSLELVVDGENGFVTEPTPEALGAAMDRLYENRARARSMGQAALHRLSQLKIDWDHTIERLVHG